MTDIRQSEEYAQFIRNIGWQVEKVGKWNAFIKKFPLIGSLIKIQRIEPPIPFEEIETLAKKHHSFQIVLEPSSSSSSLPTPDLLLTSHPHPYNYRPLKSPFIPTKTLILDLNLSEKEIFNNFSKNKRRDIRIAERNNLVIKEGSPEQFYELKKKFLLRKRILPFGMKNEIFPLCEAFGSNAKILLVSLPNIPNIPKIPNRLLADNVIASEVTAIRRDPAEAGQSRSLAGILLLFHKTTIYYWQAASTKQGNKLLAPTLLLWEAIKLSKKKECKEFDFEGIYDERFPQNKSWLGFTHFKQGFGGKEVEFPLPLSSSKFPLNL